MVRCQWSPPPPQSVFADHCPLSRSSKNETAPDSSGSSARGWVLVPHHASSPQSWPHVSGPSFAVSPRRHRFRLGARAHRGRGRARLRCRGAEQHRHLQASAALGGQHHLHDAGLQLLLWRGAAAGPGLGLHSRQGRPHPHQLPRGGRRQSRHQGAVEQQAQLRRQGHRHRQGSRSGSVAD